METNKENIALWVDRDTHIAIKTAAAQAGLTIKAYLKKIHVPEEQSFSGDDVRSDAKSFDEFMQLHHMKENPDFLDDELADKYNDWVSTLDYVDVLNIARLYNAFTPEPIAYSFCQENGLTYEVGKVNKYE